MNESVNEMLSFKQPTDQDCKRETIVVEWQYPEEVGSGEEGYKKTVEYIDGLFDHLGVSSLQDAIAHPHTYQLKEGFASQLSIDSSMPEPKAHLCGKYGFAGFGTGEKGVYGHAYFWDKHASGYEEEPPFATMDVSYPAIMSDQIKPGDIIDYTRRIFSPRNIEWKSSKDPDQFKEFVDLAPHILRQRLLIQGLLSNEVRPEQIATCMEQLCEVLKMGQLSTPEVYNNFAFMHWEDSGTVASWTKDLFNIDIYTCKGFEAGTAIDLLKDSIDPNIINVSEI